MWTIIKRQQTHHTARLGEIAGARIKALPRCQKLGVGSRGGLRPIQSLPSCQYGGTDRWRCR